MSKLKKLDQISVFENKWLKVDEVRCRFPDDKTGSFYVVRGNPVVAVLGITLDKRVVLVRQYRLSIGRYMIDIPGGGVEKGEDKKEAAKREFFEETGYEVRKLKQLTRFYFDSGRSDKYSTIYVGQAVNKKRRPNNENERIDLLEISYDDLIEDMKKGKIIEPTVKLAVFSLSVCRFKEDYL